MLLATVAVTTTTGGRWTAPLLLLLLLLLDAGGVLAQDARAWYKANPGMVRIRRVNQATNQIVDDFGRTRFFHGTNVVMKEAPWHRPAAWKPGTPSFGAQDVRNLRDLGLNVVRLGHSWAGAEPTARGRYNETFLEIMRRQTKLAEDHGLYVLVDVHQDCLARQFCGHGVPDWFARKDWVSSWLRYPFPLNKLRPFPVDGDGFPTPPSVCGSVDWALSYTSVALSNAFGRLYRNDDGLADAFAAYWQRLASGYAGARNVVGYNLLNEPLRTYAPDNRTLALFTASGVRAATEISVTVTRKGPPREAL
ncbi:Glycoside hydrolase, superfamily [Moelleriella libera RCEF 2490]|uniref:Glycoside hydrolase, superfamily n=1 Tax=Moelleriella libera RCEF 2490 TaxID=1081109 RepID=A0A166P405_9HYPO|nr:Glycoside hydrolase, superfamily [Moelleriella libera RCEF 2490]